MRNFISTLICAILFASCADNGSQLEKMIPQSVDGIIRINLTTLLKEGDFLDKEEAFTIPTSISEFCTENPTSIINEIVTQLPHYSINYDSNLYIFFPRKSFDACLLVELTDCEKTQKWIERQVGEKFNELDGIKYVASGNSLYFIYDNVLLYAQSSFNEDKAKFIKEARKILEKDNANISNNEEIGELLKSEKAIVSSFTPQLLLKLSKKYPGINNINQKFPLIRLMSESDIDAVEINVGIKKDKIIIESEAISRNKSTAFADFIKSIENRPSSAILSPFPNSMEYVVGASVKGNSILKIKEINNLLDQIGKMPFINTINIEGIIGTINGPIAIGMSKDQVFQDEYNTVVALTTDNPDYILDEILKFGKLIGQNPEIKNGEYIYEYMSKPIRVGVNNKIVYLKMLDYEQTEPSLIDDKEVKDLFSKSPISLYVSARNPKGVNIGNLYIGSETPTKCNGLFIPSMGNNSVQSILILLGDNSQDDAYNANENEGISGGITPIDKMEKF